MDEIEVKKPSRRVKRDAPKYKQIEPVKPVDKSKYGIRYKRDLPKKQVVEVAPVSFESELTTTVSPEQQIVTPAVAYTKPKMTNIVTPEPVKSGHKARGVMVGLVGAGIIGYMGFEGLKLALLDKGYTDDQAKQYASISAGVCSLITFLLLYKLAKN
jgi:hypothetical protein